MAIDAIPKHLLADVEYLTSALTLEEKISLLAGADEWQTRGVERLGIGSLKISDGPAGARGKLMVDGPRAAFLPAPVMQAATWSRPDVKAIGQLLCKEAKSKAAHVLAAPTICCHRNPLGGRNFESFSEDPFLSGALAIEYVAGIQESGEVVATAKHFVANEQESERFSVNAIIDEQALREIYLRPFEMLIKSQTPPGCIMTAYNRVNGTHMDMHTDILQGILRDQWSFDGLVMSDWGGTNSAVESVIAGCDLEMPGPPVQRGLKLLEAALTKSNVSLRNAIDDACRRVLTLAKKMNLLGLSPAQVRQSRSQPEQSQTSREDLDRLQATVASAHVLLKNSIETLPLCPSALQGKKIAFIGPNAIKCSPGGGGSATMNPQYQSHPVQAFRQSLHDLGVEAEVSHAVGAHSMKWLPLADTDQWTTYSNPQQESSDQRDVFRIDFFSSADMSGPVFETQYRCSSNIDLTDSGPFALREAGTPYSLRVTSQVTPRASGKHTFSITSVGNTRLWVGSRCLIDNSDWTERGEAFYAFSSQEVCASLQMTKGQSYEVVVEASSKMPEPSEDIVHVWSMQPSVRLGFLEELSQTLVDDAVALANCSDYTVVAIGLNEEWESEGYDRQTMALPGKQDELVYALLEQTKRPENIIVVNQSGAAVEMPWADQASTILQAWYGGQEAGNALADVLLGLKSPSGRLPFTWPHRYEDLSFGRSTEAWPGVKGDVHYAEVTAVGYRWHIQRDVQPQWWFGHGLGYSCMRTQPIEVIERAGQGWEITVNVKNLGSMAAQEVVQLYSWPQSDERARVLRAFDKTGVLAPEAEEFTHLCVQQRDMASWEEGQWALRAGTYTFGLCKDAGSVLAIAAMVDVPGTIFWKP